MTLRGFIITMFFATLICWAAFAIVIFSTNPYEAGTMSFVFFYLSLLLSLTGTITIIGIFVRLSVLHHDDFISRRVSASFRQGAMLAIVICAALLLMSKNLLTWWNIMFFILGISLLEFFFISLKRLK